MIPKTIHYIWLGGKALPAEIEECVDTWRKAMPDYQLRLWSEADLPEIRRECPRVSAFVDEALAERKWAFASDVIRLYALYTHGGIYLDTDVRVFKSYDALLVEEAFTGREGSMHIVGGKTLNYLTTCCIGASKGSAFIKECLDYYQARHFVTTTNSELPAELRLDMRLNSEVMCILAQRRGYNASVLERRTQRLEGLTVYPADYFDPTGRQPESYCEHLALGTWREGERKVWTYTLRDKISWRVWALAEKAVRRFRRTIIKLQ